MEIKLGSSESTMGSLAVGAIALLLSLALVMPSVGTGGWDSAEGTIVRSDVSTTRTRTSDGKRKRRSRVSIEYSYTVGGAEYTNDAVHVSDNGLGGFINQRIAPWRARSIAREYPEGAQVTVMHDPDDPANSALDTGMSLSGLLLLVVGVAGLGLGAFQALAMKED